MVGSETAIAQAIAAIPWIGSGEDWMGSPVHHPIQNLKSQNASKVTEQQQQQTT